MNELDKFGEIYINDVRDRSLSLLKNLIEKKIKAPRLQRLQQELEHLDDQSKKLAEELSITLIDNVIHNTLFLFESHDEIKLMYENLDLNDLSDGLSGELYSDDGWIKQYSQYPSSND